MNYLVNVPEGRSYVLVKVNCDVTKDVAGAYTKDATKLCRELGLCCILVDVRGYSSLSGVMGKYEFAYRDGAKMGLTPSLKIVVLRDEGREDMQFLETVMNNAGFNYRVLVSEEAAIAWLES